MGRPKSYIVRVWRKAVWRDFEVFGIVEELDAGRKQVCETIEEFIAVLERRARARPPRKQTFGSFMELTRILESLCGEEAHGKRPRLYLLPAHGRDAV